MNSNFTSQQTRSIIDGFQGSGMTQAQYAKSNGISLHTLRYWLYKGRKSSSSTETGFIELKNVFGKNDGILLRYPNGVELQLPVQTSLQTLKTLISL